MDDRYLADLGGLDELTIGARLEIADIRLLVGVVDEHLVVDELAFIAAGATRGLDPPLAGRVRGGARGVGGAHGRKTGPRLLSPRQRAGFAACHGCDRGLKLVDLALLLRLPRRLLSRKQLFSVRIVDPALRG